MRWDLDLFQWHVIKFGGLIVVALIVFVHVVKLVKEAIAEIREPHARRTSRQAGPVQAPLERGPLTFFITNVRAMRHRLPTRRAR